MYIILQPTLLYVVDNKQTLEADTICGMLLSDSQCPSENPELNWTIEIDKNRPAAPKVLHFKLSTNILNNLQRLISISNYYYYIIATICNGSIFNIRPNF